MSNNEENETLVRRQRRLPYYMGDMCRQKTQNYDKVNFTVSWAQPRLWAHYFCSVLFERVEGTVEVCSFLFANFRFCRAEYIICRHWSVMITCGVFQENSLACAPVEFL